MPNGRQSSFQDRHRYVPPSVARAMNRQMQRMPHNMKQYSGSGYVPQHVENAMAKHLEKGVPDHMKKYAGAYLQQQVVSGNRAPSAPSPSGNTQQPHITSNFQGHYQAPPQEIPSTGQAVYSEMPPQPDMGQPPSQHGPQFDFIMNPEQPSKRGFNFGGSSLLIKVGVIAGGILILVVLFSILRGVLGGSSNMTAYTVVVQDQQELIHLTAGASTQQGLTTSNQNFLATASTSLTSSQNKTLTYMSKNGLKVKPKVLTLKISKSTDDQLSAAASAGTYNATLKEVMNSKLKAYQRDLQQTYNQVNGKLGRAMLSDQFDQASLLITQLNSNDN